MGVKMAVTHFVTQLILVSRHCGDSWLKVVRLWSFKKQVYENKFLETLDQTKSAESDPSLHVWARPLMHISLS